MDLKKYNERGITGLLNLGNTCFLNSCIQLLNNTFELYKFFESNNFSKFLKDNPDATIMIEYNELRKKMFETNGMISPNRFIHYIQEVSKQKKKEIFSGFNQNDMPEFLLFLIDCMHNSICRPTQSTISGNPSNNTDKRAIICYKFLKEI